MLTNLEGLVEGLLEQWFLASLPKSGAGGVVGGIAGYALRIDQANGGLKSQPGFTGSRSTPP